MKIYLIAKKLSHSFSPLIHTRLADYSYELKELCEDELDEFFAKRDFDGLNVTIPYKQTVMRYLDALSKEARDIGAVNTIVNRNGILTGYNTDYFGFIRMAKKSGISLNGKNTVIIGSGGASKTVVLAAKKLGASSVRVLAHKDNVPEKIAEYYDAEIIVNTTPVGMFPANGEAPIDLRMFKKCCGVMDLIYNPAKPKLLLDAEKLKIKYTNGLSMLIAQAKKAAEIFTDTDISEKTADLAESDVRALTMNIVIIGMPGCGKTTIGRMLAEKLGREFYDIDEEIEKDGKSPKDIINKYGEDEFRRIETGKCQEICKKSGCVISSGGGVVMRGENRDILRQNGIVIFINRPPNELATENRPLSGGGGDALLSLYKKRLPLYRDFCTSEIRGSKYKFETLEHVLEEVKRSLFL